MFRVGQKVVCVNADPDPETTGWCPGSAPIEKQVYTVRAVGPADDGEPGLRLHELILRGSFGDGRVFDDYFYHANRFRPLVTTDISIFTAMLRPTRVDA